MVVPDIAFQLGDYAPIRTRQDLLVDITFFLRTDKKSAMASQRSQANINRLISIASNNTRKVSFRIVD